MNPSTAAAARGGRGGAGRPGRDPPEQQEHHPGGRAGRRRDRPRRSASCPPRASPRASPPCWPTTPRPTADDNAEAMAEAAAAVVAGEVTQAVRDSTCDARARSPRATSSASPATASGPSARARRPRAHVSLLDVLVDRRPRDRHDHRGRGRHRRRSPATSREWLEEHRPDVASRGPPRRPAALPVPLRHRVASARESATAPLAPDSRRARAVDASSRASGPSGPRRWRKLELAHRPRPADPLPAPLPRPDQRRRRIGELERRARRPRCWSRSRRVEPRRRTQTGKTIVEVRVTDGIGLPAVHVLQPALAGAAAPRRAPRPMFFGKVDVLPGPAADDEPGGRPRRRRDRPRSWPSTRSPRRPASTRGTTASGSSEVAAPRRAGASPTRSRRRPATGTTSSTARRRSTTSTCPSRWTTADEARRRLVFDELLRVQLALVLRKRSSSGPRPGIVHDLGGRAGATRFHERLPFPLTGAQQRVIAEIDGRPGRPASRCTGCCRATSASGKTVVAVSALLVAVQGGHQGALMAPDRGAGRAAPPRHARRCSTGFTVPDDRRRRLFGGAGRCAVELLTNRTTGGGAPAHAGRAGGGRRSTCVDRHPRADPGGSRVPVARRGRHRRAAPLRRRAAGRPAGRRRGRRRCPTCW